MNNDVLRPVHGAGLAAIVLIEILAGVRVLEAVLRWLAVDPADQYRTVGGAVAAMLQWISVLAFVGAAATFMVWMYRARLNSEAITSQHQHRFTRMWAVLGWFIPIAGIFIPYAVMQDIWRGSDWTQRMVGLRQRPYATILAVLSIAAAVLAARVIRQINELQVSEPSASLAPAA